MSKDKGAPVAPPLEFDDAGWDGSEIEAGEVLQSCLDLVLSCVDAGLNLVDAQQLANTIAVEASIEASILAVDMLFIERDDNAVTSTSIANASWIIESAPDPCSSDTWLRAAIPESQLLESTPYALEQFLRGQSPARPGSLLQTINSRRSTPTQQASREGMPRSTSRARPDKALLGPEARAAESRLREELAIRKSQAEKAREQEAKDLTDKAKLVDMQRELKGREYTYDHKGQVVVLDAFNADRPGGHANSTEYRVAMPGDPDLLEAKGAKGRSTSNSGKKAPGSMPAAAAAAAHAAHAAPSTSREAGGAKKGSKERKLVNDFREGKSVSQPSALDTLNPTVGVTLRQGAQTKMGPQRPKAVQMSRDEYMRYVAAKRAAQESGSSLGFGGMVSATSLPSSPPADPARAVPGRPAVPSSGSTLQQPAYTPGLHNVSGDEARWMVGGHPKAAQAPQVKPSTPDVNLMLTQAPDWGTESGSQGFDAPASLPVAKPNERQRELEVGRTVRLPRDRASMSTMAPPLSPVKNMASSNYGRVQG